MNFRAVLMIGVVGLMVASCCKLAYDFGYNYNKNTKVVSEVSVPTNTVKGDIISDLSNAEEYDSINKIVVKHKTNGRVVWFTTDFNFGSVANAVEQLKKLESESSEPIYLLLDSPGGSVFDGATLISQMEASIYTVCTRLCASMAAMTHSYGAKRLILDRAILMYHPASGGVQGQVPNMVSLLKSITRYIDRMNANIVGRSNLNREEYERLVAYEIWIDSEDSVKKGLSDEIVSLDVTNRPLSLDVANRPYDSSVSTDYTATDSSKSLDFQLISPHAKDLW